MQSWIQLAQARAEGGLPQWDSVGYGPPPCLDIPCLGVWCQALILLLLILAAGLQLRPGFRSGSRRLWRLYSLGFAALAAETTAHIAWTYSWFPDRMTPPPWLLAMALLGAVFCLVLSFRSDPRRAP